MTLTEFEKICYSMREMQKAYFAFPKHKISERREILNESKRLEKIVDAELERKQKPSLFDG